MHVDEIAEKADDIFEAYEGETHFFDENVSARYIGRQIGSMLSSSPELQERVVDIFKRETQNILDSKMGLLMKKYPLESATRIIRQILRGMEDKIS